MIRPIQRLPSVLLLLERLLKYTPMTHVDYQQLTNAIEKLREVAKKLNEERGKTEKHLSLFSIVNSIDNCPVRIAFKSEREKFIHGERFFFQPELLAAHRDYLQKFNLIELSQELTGKRTHLTLFLFSDCIEVSDFEYSHTHTCFFRLPNCVSIHGKHRVSNQRNHTNMWH